MTQIGKVIDYSKNSQVYLISNKLGNFISFANDFIDHDIKIHDIVVFKNSVFRIKNKIYKTATLVEKIK